jgi:polysaccharide export outer membrane protein
MRGVHAAILCLLAALALSGCASRSGPVAAMQPRSDLDSRAYGEPYGSGPRVAVAYAAVPMPAAYDLAYRLDAGDKLRVMVYGQEGLTNTYSIDAGGAITMPLIGSVPARWRPRSPPGCAAATSATPRWRSRSNPIGRSSSLAKSQLPANILTCPT